VERSEWVRVEAQDAEGGPLAFESRGLQARVIQHELDHLDGVLFIDRLPPVTRDRIKKKIQKEGLPAEAPHHAFAL
jgi:peptide deformylase